MKQSSVLSVLLAVVLVMASCGGSDSGATSEAADGDWVLQSLVLEADMAIALPERPIELRIDGDQFGGDAGCNSMGGTAAFAGDGGLAISNLGWTEMACADIGLMEFESQYTQALSNVISWSINGDQLTLHGPGVEAIYNRKVAPPDLPIIDTTWRIDTFIDGDSASSAPGLSSIRVTFSRAGVRVSAPCWAIEGFATVEPGGEGNLATDFTSADPDYTCDERPHFADVLDRLSGATEYRIDENRLTLSAGGSDLLSLRG